MFANCELFCRLVRYDMKVHLIKQKTVLDYAIKHACNIDQRV